MESDSVISARNVGVRYDIYRKRARSLKRTLFQFLRGRLRREDLWALRDVSLEVHHGEVLGLIGPNGAGKSTLCMVLAQILEPDEGEVIVRGRVAPILSLGAGFNKEMTGLENIRLSCALMGYSQAEIRRMEDEIIEFSEQGNFIHNPIRTYSSGMRARLAFAIATSVEPDILIVDEALSVGDESFRRKCEARMRELMERARAIVLVSHSMEAIRSLCTTAVWLKEGRIVARGPAAEVVERYSRWQETANEPAARHSSQEQRLRQLKT